MLFVHEEPWIGDFGASYHITSNDTGLCDVTNINNWYKVVQTVEKVESHMAVRQLDRNEKLHVLWHVKYSTNTSVNLLLPTANSCKAARY